MTHDQWSAEERRLKAAITRAKNGAKAALSLAAKIDHLAKARQAEAELMAHRRRVFDLVPAR